MLRVIGHMRLHRTLSSPHTYSALADGNPGSQVLRACMPKCLTANTHHSHVTSAHFARRRRLSLLCSAVSRACTSVAMTAFLSGMADCILGAGQGGKRARTGVHMANLGSCIPSSRHESTLCTSVVFYCCSIYRPSCTRICHMDGTSVCPDLRWHPAAL